MSRRRDSLRETTVPLLLVAGDTLVTFAALALEYWLRDASAAGRLGIEVSNATFRGYLPLLLTGVALLLAAFAQFGLYDSRLALRRYQSLNAILKGSTAWLLAYLGAWLVLKLDPPISRLFAVMGFGCVVVLLTAWRALVFLLLTRTPLVARLRRRAVLLGWNDDARALAAALQRDPAHPFALVGVVALPGSRPPFAVETGPPAVAPLGEAAALEAILQREAADLLIVARLDLPRGELQRIAAVCERAYVELKLVPGAFDIFLSGLRLQTVGGVPVLGVEELAINRLFNRVLKRALDVAGALAGLLVSAPLMLVLAWRIRRESPEGPVLFRQVRIGADHRPFTLYKLRSMRPDAAASDAARVSTPRGDPRLLRIGAWMRRWNLDELPQFWNVLRGEMSLVGPRPERPHHVEKLAETIAHYLPRHLVKPGMTGWAQVNGLRGGSDLSARVQHDIFYIENWSVWLDVQILLLTFVRWRAPEE
jgi:exopolysaccharide biosynthesis polyprenyl glycosylphosphotransferase